MRRLPALLSVAALLMMGSTNALARVAHADSDPFSLDTVTAVDDPAWVPRVSRLAAIYPNPFNPNVTIAFTLAADGRAELAIYDLRGRLVKVVASGARIAGDHKVIWDGTGRDGREVASGTYFCRLVAGGHQHTSKLLLAK